MLEENEAVVMYPDSEATFSASQDFEMFTVSFGISQLENAFRALVREGLNKFIGKTGEISLPGRFGGNWFTSANELSISKNIIQIHLPCR